MINTTVPGEAPGPAGIVLRAEAQREFTVTPAPGAEPFEPFSLPRVPVSLLAWCGTLAGMFRQRHARCLTCLLTLHPQDRRWMRAVIAPQRCEATRSSVTSDGVIPEMPAGSVVAGSSQCAVLTEPAQASWLVPTFDGVHVVDDVSLRSGGEPVSHCFVRAGGTLFPVSADAVVFDDWFCALRQQGDRLTFE